MRPEILALIPARGGSKSIPRKNLIELAGKPLIAYTIEQALSSRHITRTIVSTDDAEIAATARHFGAEAPFMRPAEFAQDLSPDIDVFRHALTWLRDNEGYMCELVVHLRPTGPVRRIALIDQAVEHMLQDSEADSLRSISPAVQTPYKMWRLADEGYMKPLLSVAGLPDAHSMPRQMLPEVFWQNGYVDIVRPRTVLAQNSMCGKNVLPYIVEDEIYEIDYPEQIPIVEAALKQLSNGELSAKTSARRGKRYAV